MTSEREPILAAHAPLYWAQGLSVIPLRFHEKAPFEDRWQQFANRAPSPAEQAMWVQSYPWANMGCVAGPSSGIAFIDLDSVDPLVDKILTQFLPSSPWTRIGAKGYVRAYRYTPNSVNFRIKGSNGKTLVECMANRCQIVLPPSVHPDTKRPYHSDTNLWEVYHLLPNLPDNLEENLRAAFLAHGIELSHSGFSKITDFVPAGSRDNTMVAMAGLLSQDITRGKLTLQEAFDRMATWYETLTEKISGDAIDLAKGQSKILEFLQRDVQGNKNRPLPIGWDKNLQPTLKTQVDQVFTAEDQEWTFTEIQAYLYTLFSKFPGQHDPEKMDGIQYILRRISKSPTLSILEIESLMKYISVTSKVPGITVAVLKKRLKELETGSVEGNDHTQIAEATIKFLEQFGELRFAQDNFWQWKGANWEIVEPTVVLKYIAENYGHLVAAKKNTDHKGIIEIMRHLCRGEIPRYGEPGINFANCYLTLSGQQLPHLPELGATYVLPYRYIPEAAGQTKKFADLLFSFWGQDPDFEEKVNALQEVIAAALFGYGTIIQRACLFFGLASTGKSTLLNIIKGLFADSAISVLPPAMWNDKFAPAVLLEKLLNVCGELSEDQMIDGKSFKEVIDGTEITAQYKGRPLFKFKPKATHLLAANHLPKTRDTTDGFNRRWLVLEFNHVVTTAKRILGLDTIILAEEREAIAAWAIQAMPRLLAQKDYTLPASHRETLQSMAGDNNAVRFFLQTNPRVKTLESVKGDMELFKKMSKSGQMYSYHDTHGRIFLDMEMLYNEFTNFGMTSGAYKRLGVRLFHRRMKELEHDFKFKIHKIYKDQGEEKVFLENIILMK